MYDHLEDIMYVGVCKIEVLESLSYYKVPHYIATDTPDIIVAFDQIDNYIIKYLPFKEDKDIIAKVEITEAPNSHYYNTIRGLVKQNPQKFIIAREW